MKVKTNLLIDLGVCIALLLALEPALTGIPIHEWLSVALTGTLVIHLLLHWNWIAGVLTRFFRRVLQVSRLQFVVDVLLFIAFNAVMLSGFLISREVLPFFGLRPLESRVMSGLHSLSADATLLLTGIHFALNWSWVVGVTKRFVLTPLSNLFKRKPQPASAAAQVQPE